MCFIFGAEDFEGNRDSYHVPFTGLDVGQKQAPRDSLLPSANVYAAVCRTWGKLLEQAWSGVLLIQPTVHSVTKQFIAFVVPEPEVSFWYQRVISFLALICSNQPQTHSPSISAIFSAISFCGFARPCGRSAAKMPISKRVRDKASRK